MRPSGRRTCRTRRFAAAALLAVAFAGSRAHANGITISDGRLKEIGATLRVGAGYSLATNRVHGSCFGKGAGGISTYSMDYDFTEVTPAALTALDNDARDFVLEHRDDRVPEGSVVRQLLGIMTVDEVSAPLADEGKGPTDEARNLMRRGDLTGFLAACGTHYVRSMKRRSRYLSLFSYVTRAGENRDAAFERELLLSLNAFDPDKERSAGEQSRDATVAAASMAHGLRVSVRSLGLGPQTSPNLPFDLLSYRASLHEAYRASQFDGVGDAVAMEIAPWIALPAVLESLDSVGHGATFAQKQMLREVADFYLEILMHTEDARALVMRANHCRRNLDWNFREEDGALRTGLETAEIVRANGGHRPLADLIAALTDDALNELEKAERTYARTGAGECLAKLEQSSLKTSPLDIPECVEHRPFSFPSAYLIEQYCPARIYVPSQ